MAPRRLRAGRLIAVGSQSPTHTTVGGAMKSTGTVRIAHTMMMAAIAHYTTSVYCLDAPQAKASSMGKYYFHIVAFELMLLSIEHSLKLTLFLETSSFPPKHNIFKLYKQVVREENFDDNFQHEVIRSVNHHASSISLPHIEEDSILRCLEKHDSSYMNFRYFGVRKKTLNQFCNGRSLPKKSIFFTVFPSHYSKLTLIGVGNMECLYLNQMDQFMRLILERA